MATSPLVETKLVVPALRGDAVARPRLTELLDQGRRARLTLVSAPAGFGKTTLLARWLPASSDRPRSVAWLSLEEGDGQPARFWTYVVTAIQRAALGVGDSALALLQAVQPPLDRVLATLINETGQVAVRRLCWIRPLMRLAWLGGRRRSVQMSVQSRVVPRRESDGEGGAADCWIGAVGEGGGDGVPPQGLGDPGRVGFGQVGSVVGQPERSPVFWGGEDGVAGCGVAGAEGQLVFGGQLVSDAVQLIAASSGL